jgi:hypothetical protein
LLLALVEAVVVDLVRAAVLVVQVVMVLYMLIGRKVQNG